MAVIPIEMPKLSDTMREGKILSWHKKEGEAVQAGEVLAEIESDKANMEMEAHDSGFLRKQLVAEGGTAPIGAVIAIVTEEADEDIGEALKEAQAKAGAASAEEEKPQVKEPPRPAAKPAPPQKAGPAPAREAARPAARAAARPAPAPAPVARAAVRDGDGHGRILASPLAFRMAAELGLDLKEIRGSGPEGRIVKRDVEEASRRGGTRPAGEATSRPAGAPKTGPLLKDFTPLAIAELPADDHEDVPVSSMRKVIASRLAESKFTAPHYYVTVEVDMRAADRAREELNQLAGLEVTYNDLVVKAAATALTRHPGVNASWQDEHIRRYSSVDIGIAVALPDGLITPVVRGCHLKTLGRISVEIKDLAERARTKKLAPEEFQGGTFTVSNMGMFGVKQFTAIINPPEAAILAVGAALDVPVVENGTIVPGRRMCLTLSADHRAVDGAQAALFLREVKLLLERPMALAL